MGGDSTHLFIIFRFLSHFDITLNEITSELFTEFVTYSTSVYVLAVMYQQ